MESGDGRWNAAPTVWATIGLGAGLVLMAVGRVLRRSGHASDRPALFAVPRLAVPAR
ncbi:hypothetical protein [Amycolatopsis sp. NPDC051071]|uniref:hypothetical protein n=1 Tax=Amycolatopsis sp. NPDC051071 TaxID=3154637 RepID=UPI0034127347